MVGSAENGAVIESTSFAATSAYFSHTVNIKAA
jgi:hypothetical protein